MVDANVLHALGSDEILVNVARGSVVDQPALIAALAERRLGGAGTRCFRRRAPRSRGAVDAGQRGPAAASGKRYGRDAVGDG